MSLHHKIDRIQRMHDLINYKRTGKPDQFARKMGLSESMLYSLLKELKSLGAPIAYCRSRESYQYLHPVEFRIGFVPSSIAREELRAINGGTAMIRYLPIAENRDNFNETPDIVECIMASL
ncbi:MAG: hypothetical protein AAF960_04560 [Bacteroidota bacterium]